MKNLVFYWVLINFIGLTTLNAQGKRQATDFIKSAEEAVNSGNLNKAKGDLEAALAIKPEFINAWRILAFVYNRLGDYAKSEEAYMKTLALGKKYSKALNYELGEVLMKKGKYNEALTYFKAYKESEAKDFVLDEQKVELNYNRLIEANLNNCVFAMGQSTETSSLTVENLGKQVNSDYDDYLPSMSQDELSLIFTVRKGDEDIFVTKRKKNEPWGSARKMTKINSAKNEGMARFSTCGRYVYFAMCNGAGMVNSGCDLFKAEYSDEGDLQKPEPMSGLVNGVEWDSQPSIACNNEVMYFSSNRKGGYGGTDIWVAYRNPQGQWSEPKNLGPTVNTTADEEAPYISLDNKTLYFTSDGHPGFGESDLFYTKIYPDSLGTPVNLGFGINSAYRELGFTLSSNNKEAYFSSNRLGGMGRLDLYRVLLPSELALPNAETVLIEGLCMGSDHKPLPAKLTVGKGDKKQVIHADVNGKFFICMPNKNVYSIIAQHNGYQDYINAEFFEQLASEPTKKLNIVLEPNANTTPHSSAIILKKPKKEEKTATATIFFEKNKAILQPADVSQLKTLLNDFDLSKPLSIDIIGYADETGSKQENIMLSKKRANAITQLLMDLGVEAQYISSQGKGIDESQSAANKRRSEVYIRQ